MICRHKGDARARPKSIGKSDQVPAKKESTTHNGADGGWRATGAVPLPLTGSGHSSTRPLRTTYRQTTSLDWQAGAPAQGRPCPWDNSCICRARPKRVALDKGGKSAGEHAPVRSAVPPPPLHWPFLTSGANMTNVRVSCATVTVTESPDVHFLPECKCICHLVYSASVFAMVLALWSFGQLSSFFLSRAIICAAHIVCHILFRKMPTRRRPRRERRRTCALVGAPFDKCDGMNRHYCPFQYAFPPIWQSCAQSLARLCLHCRLCSKSLAARRTCLPEDEEEQPNWFVLPPPPPHCRWPRERRVRRDCCSASRAARHNKMFAKSARRRQI